MAAIQPRYVVYRNTTGTGGLILWDTQTSTAGSILDAGNVIPEKGCVTLDGLFAFFRGGARIVKVDLTTFAVTTITTASNFLASGGSAHQDICCSPDGSVLYMVGVDNRLAAVNAVTGSVITTNTTLSLAFSNSSIVSYDGTRVFVSSGSGAGPTRSFNTTTLAAVWTSSSAGFILGGTKAGKLLALNASTGNSFLLLDALTGIAGSSIPFVAGTINFYGAAILNDDSAFYYLTSVTGSFSMVRYDLLAGAVTLQTVVPNTSGGANITNISPIFIDTLNQKIYHGGRTSGNVPVIQVFDIATATPTTYPQSGLGVASPFVSATGFASVFAPSPGSGSGETPGDAWMLFPATGLPAASPPPAPPPASPWTEICSGAAQAWIIDTPGD